MSRFFQDILIIFTRMYVYNAANILDNVVGANCNLPDNANLV